MCDLHLCQCLGIDFGMLWVCTCVCVRFVVASFCLFPSKNTSADTIHSASLKCVRNAFHRKICRSSRNITVFMGARAWNKGEIQMRENKWQNHSGAVTCLQEWKMRVLGENNFKSQHWREKPARMVKETYILSNIELYDAIRTLDSFNVNLHSDSRWEK